MLEAVPKIVGAEPADSWKFLLRIVWESGFRISDVLNFSWDDQIRIHPKWPSDQQEHATVVIPSTQKNGKAQEIPMLPGLRLLLDEVRESERTGSVVKLLPIEYAVPLKKASAFQPTPADLGKLIVDYSNCSIARACDVSDQAVRKWLRKLGLERSNKIRRYGEELPAELISKLRRRASGPRQRARSKRLSKDRVSRIVSAIGEEARIVVQHADPKRGHRIKFASAHDLRRSLAERMYNMGISAETLMVIMRHQDFATTQKFYAAKLAAQSAATEIHKILGRCDTDRASAEEEDEAPHLSTEEFRKLKSLLDSL